MPDAWRHYESGLFTLDLPADWVPEDHPTGSLLIRDRRTGLAMHLHAVSKSAPRPAPAPPARIITPDEVSAELRDFIRRHRRVRIIDGPQLLPASGHVTCTALGLQRVREGIPWYKRLLRRGTSRTWRFWAVMNAHMLVLASCAGAHDAVEKARPTLDRVLASLRLPQRDLLVGRRFTEAVASIARGCFPQTSVAMIDDVHLRFGSCQVDLVGLHRRYLAAPEDLPGQVRSFFREVQRLHDGSATPSHWEQARRHILPLLAEPESLADFGPHCVHEEWVNDLHVVYVVEDALTNGGACRAVTADEADAWGIDLPELHEQALENLMARSVEVRMAVSRGEDGLMLSLSEPDGYNASRLLLPGFSRTLRDHLGPTFYVGIPAREVLIAFRAKTDAALERARAQLRADYQEAAKPVSNKLFVATLDGIAGDPRSAEWFTP